MNWIKNIIMGLFFFVVGTILGFLVPVFANAWTATVEFDVSADPTDRTVVLVSETSGDYSASYGQTSEPGADSVKIVNIKPSTDYFFVAYRLTATNVRSIYSEEYAHTTEANAEPEVYDLPPIETAGVVLNISISVE